MCFYLLILELEILRLLCYLLPCKLQSLWYSGYLPFIHIVYSCILSELINFSDFGGFHERGRMVYFLQQLGRTHGCNVWWGSWMWVNVRGRRWTSIQKNEVRINIEVFLFDSQSKTFVRIFHDSSFSKLPSNPKGNGVFVRFKYSYIALHSSSLTFWWLNRRNL